MPSRRARTVLPTSKRCQGYGFHNRPISLGNCLGCKRAVVPRPFTGGSGIGPGMARKRIGELLLERKAITPQQLEQGLAHHRKTRQRLGVALIQLGFLTESALAQVLSAALNIPAID